MAATLVKFVIPFLALMIFVMGFIGFGVMLPQLNGASQSISNDSAIGTYINEVNNSAIKVQSDANIAEGAIGNSTVQVGFVSLVDSTRGVWKILTNTPKTVYSLTIGLLITNLFGDSQIAIIIGVVGAMIIVILIAAVVALIGRSDGG